MKKGNMYPDVKPWNPLGGECPHGCSYCSTKTMMRFPEVWYKYSGELRLFSSLYKMPKTDKLIFVAGQNDLFANRVGAKIILYVLEICKQHEGNRYLFQTKNPARYHNFLFDFPKGSILCTTIETNRWYPGVMGITPLPSDRAAAMGSITHYEKHVTIEPIIDFDLEELVALIRISKATKVNIGADSKHNHLPEPSKDKVLALIDELQKFTTIDRKTNLQRLLK